MPDVVALQDPVARTFGAPASAIGLVGMTGYYGDGIVALPEIERLQALGPVFVGDAISVRAQVPGHVAGERPRYGKLAAEARRETKERERSCGSHR